MWEKEGTIELSISRLPSCEVTVQISTSSYFTQSRFLLPPLMTKCSDPINSDKPTKKIENCQLKPKLTSPRVQPYGTSRAQTSRHQKQQQHTRDTILFHNPKQLDVQSNAILQFSIYTALLFAGYLAFHWLSHPTQVDKTHHSLYPKSKFSLSFTLSQLASIRVRENIKGLETYFPSSSNLCIHKRFMGVKEGKKRIIKILDLL